MRIIDGRTCTEAQRRRLAEALLDAFGAHYPQWTLAAAETEIAASDGLPSTVVAVESARVLGCASLLGDDEVDDWPDRYWLGNVVVLESARNRGVGAALVTAVERRAAAAGIRELHLVTDGAEDWYAHRGWSRVGVGVVHGHHMTVMSKRVPREDPAQ